MLTKKSTIIFPTTWNSVASTKKITYLIFWDFFNLTFKCVKGYLSVVDERGIFTKIGQRVYLLCNFPVCLPQKGNHIAFCFSKYTTEISIMSNQLRLSASKCKNQDLPYSIIHLKRKYGANSFLPNLSKIKNLLFMEWFFSYLECRFA